MVRTTAYWTTNLYIDPAVEPDPAAPLQDLAPAAAGRFRTVRDELLQIPGVTEVVRHMGASWHWAWEYGIGSRKLCWLHSVRQGPGVTFTVSDVEESYLTKVSRLPDLIRRAVAEAQRTGPLKWCGVELTDQRAVRAFASFARHKGAWLTMRPTPTRGKGRRASPKDDDLEAE